MMSTPPGASWQERRNRLNHYWLPNRYVNALRALSHALDRDIGTPGVLPELLVQVRQWEEKSSKLHDLLETFETEMSPRILFTQSPLVESSDSVKSWLPDLVHELWRHRLNTESLLRRARTAKGAADHAYTKTQNALQSVDLTDVGSRSELENAVDALAEACSALSRAISDFPHEVES